MKTTTCGSIIRCYGFVMAAAMVMLVTARVDATIVNVAATGGVGGNTVRTSDGNNGVGTWMGGGANQWFFLTDPSFTGTVIPGPTEFLNADSTVGTSTAPELTMSLASPDPLGIYNVYVVYQTSDNGPTPGGSTVFSTAPYNVQAGLSAGSLSVFDSSSGGYTGGNRILFGGARYLNERRVLVGTEIGPTLSLYVKAFTGFTPGNDNETRWEGLAFEQIGTIPEPSSVMLLSLGGLVLWRRCRK